jgi:hypothetical protein
MEFDNTVQELRELDDDSFAPPRVDLMAAMATGRARRRNRRLAGAGASVVGVVAVIAAAPFALDAIHHHAKAPAPIAAASTGATPTFSASSAPTALTCVEHRLPVPDRQLSTSATGEPSGRYLEGNVYSSAGHLAEAVIWDNGKVSATFSIPGASQDAGLVDISSTGVAIGTSYSGDSERSWIYQDAKVSRLAGPAGAGAVAINDQGVVVGTLQPPGSGDQTPIVWRTPTSTAKRLPLPANSAGGQAQDIDADGTIVGTLSLTKTPGADEGVAWRPDGTIRILPLPAIKGVNGLRIHQIHDGIISAEAEIITKDESAFVPVTYDLKTGAYNKFQVGPMWMRASNARGWIIGSGVPGEAIILWTPGTGPITLKSGYPRNSPLAITSITDDGNTIIGTDTATKNGEGVYFPVAWRCH